MNSILRRRPQPATIISCIALAIALTGTSYAAFRLPSNSVGTKQLKNGAVTKKKIARAAISALRGARGPRGLPGATGAPGPTGATGAMGIQGIPGSVGPTFGRSATGSCDPSNAYITCASTGSISLPTAGRVLLIGTSQWHNNASPPPNNGACRLAVDGAGGGVNGPGNVLFGEITQTHSLNRHGSVSTISVTDPLEAGPHTFTLECAQVEGDVVLIGSTIVAVLLGGA